MDQGPPVPAAAGFRASFFVFSLDGEGFLTILTLIGCGMEQSGSSSGS